MVGSRIYVPDIDDLRREIFRGGTYCSICYAPRNDQNVQHFATSLVVASNKERCGRLCFKIFNMSTGQSRTLGSSWKVETIVSSGMEMEKNNDGFWVWITKNSEKKLCHMGNS